MATEHVDITDPEIHEPKGVATAAANSVYIANGLGSGSWHLLTHAAFTYTDLTTGTTYTAPTSYTLVNPTTVGDSDPSGFTHNSAGRLTYTGTPTIDVSITGSLTVKHSAGAGVDVYFAIYKNGSIVASSECVDTADSSTFETIPIIGHFSMATNDYFDIRLKAASGNVTVYAMKLIVHGH